MKKLFGILVLALVSFSCSQDIKNNTPAFQGVKDNVLWKAGDVSASLDATLGVLTITAYNNAETVQFALSYTEPGVYELGTAEQDNFATYQFSSNGASTTYDTDIYPGPVYAIDGILTAGTNYFETNNALTTFSTSSPDNGSGLRLSITDTDANGAVMATEIISRGNGYYPGDEVIIVGGDNNATVRVLNTQYSNGEVVIESVANGVVTGTFKFNATDGTSDFITFAQGQFYNVPIL